MRKGMKRLPMVVVFEFIDEGDLVVFHVAWVLHVVGVRVVGGLRKVLVVGAKAHGAPEGVAGVDVFAGDDGGICGDCGGESDETEKEEKEEEVEL